MGLISFKTRNVIHLALGFLCVFFAFNSQGFIEQTVIDNAAEDGNLNSKAGYYSLAIIYAFSMATNLVVAPAIDFLGPRWSMACGGFMYTLFQMGMLFLNEPYLYVSSALVGIGSAFIWSGQGKYLTLNSSKKNAGRNSSMLWGMLQISLLGGGIFLFGVFSGVEQENRIDKKTRMIIYGVFTGVSFVGNILCALLPMKGLVAEKPKEQPSQWQILSSAFRLLGSRYTLLLIIPFAYTGLELSYWSGVYSTAISFTKRFEYNTHKLVAFNAMCQGVGQIIGGLCFGAIGSRFFRLSRNFIVITGYVVHLICFVLSFINFPFRANIEETYDEAYIKPSIPLTLVVGVVLGFGDACWNTQCYSIIVDMFHDKPAQAFSIMKFSQATAACVAFLYTSEIELQWVLLILLITSTMGVCSFFYVDRHAQALSKMQAKKDKEKSSTANGSSTLKENDNPTFQDDSIGKPASHSSDEKY